jgi:hypothetical protein
MCLNEMVLGKELGCGVSRRVYVNNLNRDQVIKYEDDPTQRHQNVMEWRIWDIAKDFPALKRWLAPCFHISPDGKYLVQARVKILTLDDKLPETLPAWMTDLKVQNFGRYKGRIVACDYGTMLAMWISECRSLKRMRKVEWWSDKDAVYD